MKVTFEGRRDPQISSIILGSTLPKQPKKKFEVYVTDNYHYMDASEAYVQGHYDTWEEALNVARKVVERSLPEYKQGMMADEMFRIYTMFGDDPYITPTPEGEHFSGWDYAKQRCIEICGK